MEKVLRSISVISRGTMRCWRMYSALEQCQLAQTHWLTWLVLESILFQGFVICTLFPRHPLQLKLSLYQLSLPCYMMKQCWKRVSRLNTAYIEKSWIFLKFLTDSDSPTLYLSESVKFVSIGPELTNLCYMRKRVPGPKNPYFENPKYFSTFLYIPVALHRTFLNHSKLC